MPFPGPEAGKAGLHGRAERILTRGGGDKGW
jgi:hypothetical protein